MPGRGQLTGDAGCRQHLGDLPALSGGARQHGYVRKPEVFCFTATIHLSAIEGKESDSAQQLFDRLSYGDRLGLFRLRFDNPEGGHTGDSRINPAPVIVAVIGSDHLPGCIQYRLAGAIVGSQVNRSGPGKIGYKAVEKTNIRAPKTVNCLIRITDHEKLCPGMRQGLYQPILPDIQILVFIHQNVGETTRDLLVATVWGFQQANPFDD